MHLATRPSRDPLGSFPAFDLDIGQLLEDELLIGAVVDDFNFASELLGIARRIHVRNPDRHRLEAGRLHLVPMLLHTLFAVGHGPSPSNRGVTFYISRGGRSFKFRPFVRITSTPGKRFHS